MYNCVCVCARAEGGEQEAVEAESFASQDFGESLLRRLFEMWFDHKVQVREHVLQRTHSMYVCTHTHTHNLVRAR